jgi:hypothetical protein
MVEGAIDLLERAGGDRRDVPRCHFLRVLSYLLLEVGRARLPRVWRIG